MLRKITVASLFIFAFLLFVKPVFALEEIKDFNSLVIVNPDTSISISETIVFATDEPRHGIYRYIPFRYSKDGLSFTAKLRNINVYDEQGQEIRFEKTSSTSNVTLKIGDPDITFAGEKTYFITYLVEDAVQLIDNQPQLLWDITGEGWTIPITNTKASITTPSTITEFDCFSGPFGGNDHLCQIDKNSPTELTLQYNETIDYGDNVTVLVKFENQGLVFPTPTQKLAKKIVDNLILLPLLLPGLIMFVWWWRRGRDQIFTSPNVFNTIDGGPIFTRPPWHYRPVPLVYEPLSDLTPGQSGALVDERADNQDVVAEIIELARLKYLKIERVKTKNIFKKDDYLFTELKSPSKLPEYQQYLLDHLFNNRNSVKLSDLKGTFYSHMSQTKALIMKSLYDQKLFIGNPDNIRLKAFIVAFVLDGLAGWWLSLLLAQSLWLAIPLYGSSLLITILAAFFMPAKTAKGSNLALQAKGLQQTIKRGAWREKIKEKHLFFEEVLPFAIALGVAKQLNRDMQKLDVKAPSYVPVSSGWTTGSFVDSFNTQVSSGLSYNPSSSSFSGGGSSGGGGGGGGGGSW